MSNKSAGIIALDVFEVIITYVFLAEVVFKTIAKFDKPWRYFYHHGIDGWNTFDFIVVAGTFLPGGGSMLVILRLLRLLRVPKLLKAFPELQVMLCIDIRDGFDWVYWCNIDSRFLCIWNLRDDIVPGK